MLSIWGRIQSRTAGLVPETRYWSIDTTTVKPGCGHRLIMCVHVCVCPVSQWSTDTTLCPPFKLPRPARQGNCRWT